MNLTQLQTAIYQPFRYSTSPPSQIVTRITQHINHVQRDLLTMPAIAKLRDDVIPITAKANQARMGLPPFVERVINITDRTNNLTLLQVPLKDLRLEDPAQAFTGGFPMRYAVIGNQAAAIQPTTAGSKLYAASSAVADSTAPNVFVESILAGGYPNTYIATGTALMGTTRVQIGARIDHVDVTKFYLDNAATGFVSLYDDPAAGNELARIPIGDTYSRYLAVEWWPIPTQDTTEYVDVTRRIYDLVKGTDEPLIPRDFHYVIVHGAVAREMAVLNDVQRGEQLAMYEKGKLDLTNWVMDDGDRLSSLRALPFGWNNLGGNYPATGYRQ